MRQILVFLLLLWFSLSLAIGQTNPNHVYVQGHYRSNGTYVEGYYRTAPNSTNRDNFSTQGNVNPYTGQAGWIPPDNNYNYQSNSNSNYSNSNSGYTYSSSNYNNSYYHTPKYAGTTNYQGQKVLEYKNGKEIFGLCKFCSKPKYNSNLEYFWYSPDLGIQSTKGGSDGTLLDGEYKFYDENGNLLVKANYKSGLDHGDYMSWDASGNVKAKSHFTYGVMDYCKFKNDDGYTVEWQGEILEPGSTKNIYTSYGTLIETSYIIDDFKYEYKLYNEYTGKLESEFTKGVGDYYYGAYKTYFSNGNLETVLYYSNNKLDGEAKAYYEDGTLKRSVYYFNDKRNGKSVDYDLNGNIESISYYKDGELNGPAKTYSNGLIDSETEYTMGLANGNHKQYIYVGSELFVTQSCPYLNGKKHGLEIDYLHTDDGLDTLSFSNYTNGIKNGPFKEIRTDTIEYGSYYDNKLSGLYSRKLYRKYLIDNEEVGLWMLDCSGYYVSGKKSGDWKHYFRGIPYQEGQYLNDQKTGLWIQTVPTGDYLGQIWGKTNYTSGKLNGKSEMFFTFNNDNMTFTPCHIIANYKNDLLNGEYISTDSLNNIFEKGAYLDGNKYGNWTENTYYHINSVDLKFSEEGLYVTDKREGIWSAKLNGDLTSKRLYSKGKLNGQSLYFQDNHVWKEIIFNEDRFAQIIYYNQYPGDTLEKYVATNTSPYYFEANKFKYYSDSTVISSYHINASIDTINVHDLAEFITDGSSFTFLHGTYRVLDKSSRVISKGEWYNGLLQGDQYKYDYDQQVYKKSNYKYNHLSSESYFDFDNKPYSGQFKVYDQNKMITCKIKVKKGLRNGQSLYYDSNGKVFRKEKYKDGVLVAN